MVAHECVQRRELSNYDRLDIVDSMVPQYRVLSGLAVLATTVFSAPAGADWPPSADTVSLVMEAAAQELAEAAAAEPPSQPAPDPILALDAVAEAEPANVDALNQRGLFRLELGNREAALADFGAAIAADPTNIDARYNQGLAYELIGRLDAAEDAYKRVRQLGPESEAGIAAWWGLEAIRQKPLFGQADVLDRFGAPDSFTLTVAAPDPGSSNLARVEIWEYYRAGKEFTFVNSELQATAEIPRMTRQEAYPLYRPYQFESGMVFGDAANSAGFEDYGHIAYEEPELEDVDLVFANQLVLGFLKERLFYVQTIPYDVGPFLPPETASAPAVTGQPEPVSSTPDPATRPASGSIADRLTKLKSLYEEGLITEEEYRGKRQQILDEL